MLTLSSKTLLFYQVISLSINIYCSSEPLTDRWVEQGSPYEPFSVIEVSLLVIVPSKARALQIEQTKKKPPGIGGFYA